MPPTRLLADALAAFERADIPYCLIRGMEHLQANRGDRELDILVAPDDRARVSSVVAGLGFLPLPSLGHAPHRFFIAYRDGWLKLDVITDLRYGSPIAGFRVGDARAWLERRRRVGGVWMLSPEHEVVHLLLHGIIDKRRLDVRHLTRLNGLWRELRREPAAVRRLSAFLERHLPTATRTEALQALALGESDGVLRCRDEMLRHLWRRDPVRTTWRLCTGRLARAIRPLALAFSGGGFSIALLGPDGSGKTTLANALATSLPLRARRVYMGYGVQAHDGRRFVSRLERIAVARSSRPSIAWRKLVGTGRFAVRVLLQTVRSLAAVVHRLLGRVVVFDRHACEVGLAGDGETGWIGARRRLLGILSPSPDLIFVLDGSPALLHLRKSEHSPEQLERMRNAYRQLARDLPGATLVDVDRRFDLVHDAVTERIWQLYVAKVTHGSRVTEEAPAMRTTLTASAAAAPATATTGARSADAP